MSDEIDLRLARAAADAARARRHKGSSTWWTVDKKEGGKR
jgi:hypothetical protein